MLNCFVFNLRCRQGTLGGGEEKLDDLFIYKEGDEATYFVSEGLGDQELDVGPSGGVATTSEKGEIATHGDKSENVEILDIPEEGRPIIEPPVEESAIGEALFKITAAEGVTPLEIAPEDVTIVRWIPL